jgi:hypothetical protein
LVSGLSSNWVLNSQEFLVIGSAWISLPHRKIINLQISYTPVFASQVVLSVIVIQFSLKSQSCLKSLCQSTAKSQNKKQSLGKHPQEAAAVPPSFLQYTSFPRNQDPARHQILPFAFDFVVEDLVWRLSHLDHPSTLLGWLCQCSISHTFACPVFVWTQHGTCRHVHASITSPILSSLTI